MIHTQTHAHHHELRKQRAPGRLAALLVPQSTILDRPRFSTQVLENFGTLIAAGEGEALPQAPLTASVYGMYNTSRHNNIRDHEQLLALMIRIFARCRNVAVMRHSE